MADPLRITIAGVPHAQPRARFVPGQAKPVSTTGPRVKRWRLLVHLAAQEAAFAVGEAELEALNTWGVQVDFEFRFPVPPKHRDWVGLHHWHKPDRDNLEKAVLDELQRARILVDDCRVAAGGFRKVWCAPKDAGCTVVISALPGPALGCKAPEAKGERPTWLEGMGG